ncbi:hypothetical protein XENTR_v10017999 [Xenopus tropicalis]|nr:hypothetical protein XENTR_v10017999 [Xenopus tropicalis]
MLRTQMRRASETRVGQSGAQGPNTEGACVPGNDREGERNKRNDWTHRNAQCNQHPGRKVERKIKKREQGKLSKEET